ncbi:MAG: hypothetical protein Q9222_003747 [Ikaeria aurantiellina]
MGNNNNDAKAMEENETWKREHPDEVAANKSKMQNDTVYYHGAVVDGSNDFSVLRLRGEIRSQVLSEAQCKSYATDGYLVIPDAITNDEATKLLNVAHTVMKRVSEGGEGITRHEISGDGAETPSPIGRVLATFEPGDKTATNPFERRIARLGCGVHKMRAFDALTHSAFNRSIARSLGYEDARITQSQLVAKLAGIGGEIVPHQDGCASFTDPPSALTFWYAFEDTNIENGCLRVAPGSHLTEPLHQRLIKQDNGQPNFEKLATPLWAKEAKERPEHAETQQKEYEYKPLEVKKGSLIVFHGNLLHKSGINLSQSNRIAYNFNIVDGSANIPEESYMKPADGKYTQL